MSCRRLFSTTIIVAAALSLAPLLAGCGSGKVHGEKILDATNLGSGSIEFAIASSDKGVVALAWLRDDQLVSSELEPSSWHWSKPEVLATSLDETPGVPDDIALAYDGSDRLLVAWASGLGNDRHGHRRGIGVNARIRDADGNWQPARLVARYPSKEARYVVGAGLTLSSGKRGFALGWYSRLSSGTDRHPNVSGFRIFDGNRWLPPVRVGAEGLPVRVELLDGQPPLALWILPLEKKLLAASLLSDGKLDKPRVLAQADSFLTTSSDAREAVAAWSYNKKTWASVWSGHSWAKPKYLGDNSAYGEFFAPLATVVARERAAVAWRIGGFTGGGSYSLLRPNTWAASSPSAFPAAHGFRAENIEAVGLASGELALLGIDSGHLGVVHLPLSGRARTEQFSIKTGTSQVLASASGARAVAFAWEADLGSKSSPKPHIFVWVYRP